MSLRLTEAEIEAFIREPKPLPANWRDRTRLKLKAGHSEAELEVEGAAGSKFVVILRRSNVNHLAFSVILGVHLPSGEIFRLRRYNGRNHEHTNPLERETFYDFHIHMATERYQGFGKIQNEERYATRTERFADLQGAIECLLEDCAFREGPGTQLRLNPRVDD